MSDKRGYGELIAPIVKDTYGDHAMAEALADHLAGRIEHDWQGYEDRERQIMLVCWDWFSGGTTAASVARRIEQALEAV